MQPRGWNFEKYISCTRFSNVAAPTTEWRADSSETLKTTPVYANEVARWTAGGGDYLEGRPLAGAAFLLARWWGGELLVPALPDFPSSWLVACLRPAGTFLAPVESAAESELADFLGGIRSLTRSRPLASSKDVMDWPIVTPLMAEDKYLKVWSSLEVA